MDWIHIRFGNRFLSTVCTISSTHFPRLGVQPCPIAFISRLPDWVVQSVLPIAIQRLLHRFYPLASFSSESGAGVLQLPITVIFISFIGFRVGCDLWVEILLQETYLKASPCRRPHFGVRSFFPVSGKPPNGFVSSNSTDFVHRQLLAYLRCPNPKCVFSALHISTRSWKSYLL